MPANMENTMTVEIAFVIVGCVIILVGHIAGKMIGKDNDGIAK